MKTLAGNGKRCGLKKTKERIVEMQLCKYRKPFVSSHYFLAKIFMHLIMKQNNIACRHIDFACYDTMMGCDSVQWWWNKWATKGKKGRGVRMIEFFN